jgi:hypothetical protein
MGVRSYNFEDRRQFQPAWIVTSAQAAKCVVVFNNLFASARKEGAMVLGIPEDQVLCERKQDYDQFAGYGRVPPRQLLADGYWFDCAHCGIRIDSDNPRTPLDNIVVDADGEVFCQAQCAMAHAPVRLKRNQRFEAFKRRIQQHHPDLEFSDFHGGYPHRFDRAQFEFPGGMFPGVVQEIEEGLSWCVSEVDAEAWHRYQTRPKSPA